MPLVLEKAQEADIPRCLDIMYAAFHDDPWDRIMYPQIPLPSARANSTKRWRREISDDPHTTVLKVVDADDKDEIIAFARWHIYRDERPDSEWRDMTLRDWDEGTNVEAANAFFTAIRKQRQKHMKGSPHCCLNMVATDPKHHRRGAGRMLVKWGTDVADASKVLPCYLEASKLGRPMYLSFGFEDVDTMDIDMAPFGGEGIHHHHVMIRPVTAN